MPIPTFPWSTTLANGCTVTVTGAPVIAYRRRYNGEPVSVGAYQNFTITAIPDPPPYYAQYGWPYGPGQFTAECAQLITSYFNS
jgi:hypothetical protein